MSKLIRFEYIWLDGLSPQQLRGKTKITQFVNYGLDMNTIVNQYKSGELKAPIWNFDGSSTNQANTSNSEMVLHPVNYFMDPLAKNSILVLCEVMNVDGTPHHTNTRNEMVKSINSFDDGSKLGFEQEYFIIDNLTNKPIGWPIEHGSFPKPQGEYYCAVGANNVKGRDFVEDHTELCLKAGISIGGTNAEVALGQWEYQIGIVDGIDGSDQLWISRYLLYRLGEKYNYRIDIEPKPFKGDEWNGSGMHVNFSTKTLREDKKNKKQIAIDMCKKLEANHKDHIEVYGLNNKHRLTGKNETSSMEKFGWGIGDRTKSIRIPSSINDTESVGYIEDRRPASNGDPYLIVDKLVKTICQNKKIVDFN